MNKEEVKRNTISLGEYYLNKDSFGNWDFYRNYDDGDIIKHTNQNFTSVDVSGEIVYVSKNVDGIIKHAIYTIKGEEKVGFKA